jgi:hypothetical protein
MIANLGVAARADSFHNRCSGSQNFIFRFATILFLSSPGWNKSAAGATNLIVEDIVFFSFYFGVWSDNRPSRLTANHKLEKAVVFTRLATR